MTFEIPVPLKIGAVVLATTALYTYIGQLVPQKEVLPPAAIERIDPDSTPDDLVLIGLEIASGQGLCFTCHTLGQSGTTLRYPDLAGVGAEASRSYVVVQSRFALRIR